MQISILLQLILLTELKLNLEDNTVHAFIYAHNEDKQSSQRFACPQQENRTADTELFLLLHPKAVATSHLSMETWNHSFHTCFTSKDRIVQIDF